MADTMGRGNTRTSGGHEAMEQHAADEQDRLAHIDDDEQEQRTVPTRAMETQYVTTAKDAQRNDQRLDGRSPDMSGGPAERHDELGTPVDPPTGTGDGGDPRSV